MDLPPLTAIKAFEVAARLRSISRAGIELNTTHAAVSHQVKLLEAWMGRRLFTKQGRGVALTPAGDELLRVATSALANISMTAARLRRRRDRMTITVGCVPSIASRWLIPNLGTFLDENPNADVKVQYAIGQTQFDPDAHDILISLQQSVDSHVTSTQLFSRMNKPVASPLYLSKIGVTPAPEKILEFALLHDETTDAWKDWFSSLNIECGTLRGPIFQDFNMLASSVLAGHGIALCPVEVFRKEIAQGDLVVLSDIATLHEAGYYLVHEEPAAHIVLAFKRWFVQVTNLL